ncbi:MAG: adenylate/guanylate cyclase domain-containing protein, partial [Actinomycetota bacterium]|nr:adenylate/guanylate cyclase domain-containing protein [Actinomycetota bacterium]
MGPSRRTQQGTWAAIADVLRPQGANVPGASMWRAGRLIVTAVIVVTNLLGVAAVILIADFVVPLPALHAGTRLRQLNLAVAAAYVAFAVPAGVLVGTSGLVHLKHWLLQEHRATPAEQRVVLRAPLRLFWLQVALWAGAAAIFGGLDGVQAGTTGARVGATIALTGMSTAACAYLLTERVLRAAVARALDQGPPERLTVPGVAARAVLAWALGTGVPVAGLVAIGVVTLTSGEATPSQLAVAMVSLGGVALTVGLLAIGLAARATADPVDSVRKALDRAQRGDFSVRVPVYDGTQVGRLQAGFNRMVAGLAERERIRAALGTYVDQDVAERILAEGTSLDGEEVEVTVMFVDVRDFTTFAERKPAREVVAALNGLFDRIVPIVHAHGGHVDKFIGDGVLAVFGAPRRLADHAAQALDAALAIERAVAVGDLRVGIGLNSGAVVAGNVGGAGRFEFGVIGDVVNTAARVEAATRQTGDTILIGGSTAALLGAVPTETVPRPTAAPTGTVAAVPETSTPTDVPDTATPDTTAATTTATPDTATPDTTTPDTTPDTTAAAPNTTAAAPNTTAAAPNTTAAAPNTTATPETDTDTDTTTTDPTAPTAIPETPTPEVAAAAPPAPAPAP